MKRRRRIRDWIAPVCAGIFLSCSGVCCEGDGEIERPEGWGEKTHSKDVEPNYDLVFAVDTVHRLDITIEPDQFAIMQDDLEEILGESGDMGGGKGPIPDEMPEGGMPGGGMPEQPGSMVSRDPIYVPVEVRHDGVSWTRVGMRYKGNSSLKHTYAADNGKLPFRLHFDKFEDEYPKLDDQRFYGFKKLTFSSNYRDDSQLREFFTAELFRDRKVAAPRCAFYRIHVDTGDGPKYWGLYTMIEDPADGAMLDSQLSGRKGNLYKPEGRGADWTAFVVEGFVKKNNEDEGDWSDVEAAISALHAETADAKTWRKNFEETFDTGVFLRWLAVNTVAVNWDTYGTGAHNYYLYGDPEQGGRLRWIPWDNNEALKNAANAMKPTGADTGDPEEEIFHSAAGDNWPLISRLLADETYSQIYSEEVERALEGLFELSTATERLEALHALIAPHVVGKEGERASHTTISSSEAFEASVNGPGGLIEHIASRHQLVAEALYER